MGTPQAKDFFQVQSTRLADPFEPLNSSLAQCSIYKVNEL